MLNNTYGVRRRSEGDGPIVESVIDAVIYAVSSRKVQSCEVNGVCFL